MTDHTPWTFTRDPLQDTFRLMAGERIIGVVGTEADAKLICDAVNAAKAKAPAG